MPHSAADIHHKLTGFLSEIRQWSKRHALDETPAFDALETLFHARGHLLGTTGDSSNGALEKELWRVTVLAAAIAASAFFRILGHPLFAFHEAPEEGLEDCALLNRDAEGVRSLLRLIESSECIVTHSIHMPTAND